MEQAINRIESEHRCLPLAAHSCPTCGELINPPVFCGICGENITPQHRCAPRPMPHVCRKLASPGLCLACGQPLPTARFCKTCGAEITPSHRCSAAPITHVPKPDPIHRCPSLVLPHCPQCGVLMPAMELCELCGMEITPLHTCALPQAVHVCSPLVTMPRRCPRCGEPMAAAQHCTQCGADITPVHACAQA